MIYLDNAATSFPKLECVIEGAFNAAKGFGGNLGRTSHSSAIKAGEAVYNVRQSIAEMFSCESERVIFTLNCTMALNMAIVGSAKKGDNIIISSMEHNSVLRVVQRLSEESFITYSVARVEPLNENKTLENFKMLINEKTSIIVCTAVSNVFGTVLPITRLGKLCKEHGIRFIVDAAQAAGYMKIDMKKQNINILCLPGHKGLMGLSGTGLMLLDKESDIPPLIVGGTGSFSMSKSQPEVYPDKLESGTLNLPGIISLGEGVKFIKSCGGENVIGEKEGYLKNILIEDLANIRNVILYKNISSNKSGAVVPLNIKNMHSERAGELLSKGGFAVRTGYHCAYLPHKIYGTEKTGVIRVSPGYFNTKKDVKNFIFYLNKIAIGKVL